MKTFRVAYALLELQKSFLGKITPEIRSIVADTSNENGLIMHVGLYYDGEVSQELIDLWESAIKKAGLDLDPDCVIDYRIERIDSPQKMPFRGRYAYLRKEFHEWDYNKQTDSDEVVKENT